MAVNRQTALSNTAVQVQKGFSKLTAVHAANQNNADVYLHFYDSLGADVIVGTTTPKYTFWIPGGGSLDVDYSNHKNFHAGMSMAVTTSATNGVAPVAGILANVDFQ